MSWSADCQLLAGDSNDAFGQSISYNDPTLAEAVTIVCPVTRERRERRNSPNVGSVWVRVRKVYVDDSEQAVRHDGTFTIDGMDYGVESLENKDAGRRTIVNVQRVAVEEITRPGYRG